ncbi:hypothetical protein LIA77_00278 [Sarocladium implicatum]|nr:hypothetical protein LIA77_00278 [Sarocladium implicatum]
MVTCCNFIKQYEKTAGSYDRIRYTLVVAFIDMLCSSTRISIMTKENDKRWFLDLYPIIWWSVSFGLMVAQYPVDQCGSLDDWWDVSLQGSECGTLRAVRAFALLLLLLWCFSAFFGALRHTAVVLEDRLWRGSDDRSRVDEHPSRPMELSFWSWA